MSAAEETPPFAKRERRRWQSFFNISVAAFMMSLTMTLISAFYAARGSELAVQAPEQLLLYRDGEGADSILTAALRTDLINLADGYGDVLTDASVQIGKTGPAFAYQATANPVFTTDAEAAAKKCDLGARCLGLPGLLVIERSDEILDIPSGEAKVVSMAFPAVGWNCTGADEACARFATFDDAVAALAGGPIEVRLRLDFHADGEREILCRTGKPDAAYLRQIGWVSLSCEESQVSGEPLL